MQETNPITKFNRKIKEYYRTNFYVNVLDGTFFALGFGFISTTTILPLFVRQLTDSKLLVSLIMAIMMFGGNLPQLLSARWAEGLSRKKNAVLYLALLMRLPWLLMAILTIILTPHYTHWLLLTFFLILSFYSFSSGLATPVWFDMVTKIIPLEKRGRFFGFRSFLSGLMGIVAAFGAKKIINIYLFPTNFVILFFIAFFSMMVSFFCLLFVKEPHYPVVNKAKSIKIYFKRLPSILKKQRNFRYYIISIIFIQFFGMANGMYTVAGIERLGLDPDSASKIVGTFTVLLVTCQSLTNILWGFISDRFGHKIVIFMAASFNMAGVLIAFFARSQLLFYLVFIMTGIALGGNSVSFMTIVPEFCQPEEKPTYIAIANTASGITSSLASLLGGLLADISTYRVVFGIAMVMMFVGIIILGTRVNEPRHEKGVN